jgi:hypothetical protein
LLEDGVEMVWAVSGCESPVWCLDRKAIDAMLGGAAQDPVTQ